MTEPLGQSGASSSTLVPDDRLDAARDVAELELQEGLAVAPLALRVGAHDEDRVDLLAVREVANEALRGDQSGLLHRGCQGRAGLGRDSLHRDGVAPRPRFLTWACSWRVGRAPSAGPSLRSCLPSGYRCTVTWVVEQERRPRGGGVRRPRIAGPRGPARPRRRRGGGRGGRGPRGRGEPGRRLRNGRRACTRPSRRSSRACSSST